jgi:hypothetical protein
LHLPRRGTTVVPQRPHQSQADSFPCSTAQATSPLHAPPTGLPLAKPAPCRMATKFPTRINASYSSRSSSVSLPSVHLSASSSIRACSRHQQKVMSATFGSSWQTNLKRARLDAPEPVFTRPCRRLPRDSHRRHPSSRRRFTRHGGRRNRTDG